MSDAEIDWQGLWVILLNPGEWSYYQWGALGITILALLLCIPLLRWFLQSIKESMNKTTYKPNLRTKKPQNSFNKFR